MPYMFRRWFIRLLVLLPIVLCIIGWGWSSTHTGWIRYSYGTNTFNANWIGCGTRKGFIFFQNGIDSPVRFRAGWHCGAESDKATESSFVPSTGFYGFDHSVSLHTQFLFLPYWFLVLIFSGLLWLIWRRTRPKPKGGAFPVEVQRKA